MKKLGVQFHWNSRIPFLNTDESYLNININDTIANWSFDYYLGTKTHVH